MKAIETAGNGAAKIGGEAKHGQSFIKVLDGRKQPIRGLWQRNGVFYARLNFEAEDGTKQNRRVRLVDSQGANVRTVPEAVKALARLRDQRDTGSLPVMHRTPSFAEAAQAYLDYYSTVTDAKRPRTLAKERGCLALWVEHFGGVRVDKLKLAHVRTFIAKRQGAGISGRTVNLDVIALRNVLKRSRDDGHLKTLPTEGLRPLKWTAKKRNLVTAADIERLCDAAIDASKNGQAFADYVRLMAYCGARRDETLRLKWADVDFERGLLTIGADGLSKNHEARVVDFNSKLETHLRAMHARRAPDSEFLFPSPQRGDRDASTKTFKETLNLARAAAGLPAFSFHDCRHSFISYAVMSGIDFMTIARWVGHRDGGVLVGKVYGHLCDDHRKQQAQRIRFGPEIVSMGAAVNG